MSSENNTDRRVADRIRQAMTVRGYTLRRMATEIGMPYRTLQDRLSGRQTIPVEALDKIATALRVSADWLLFGRRAAFDPVILSEALDTLDGQGLMSLRQRAKWLADMYWFLYDDQFNVRVHDDPTSPEPLSRPRPRR